MSGATVGWIVLGLIVLAVVIALGVWLLNWLYRRSTKETAFVRTGWGGEKVVKDGGAFVLPIVHEVIPVNMNTLRLEVRRDREAALITKNRMRVDVLAEFYVRVAPSKEAISFAAQSLGRRTMQPEALRELVEGRFVDSLRSVAAEFTMEQLHEQRGDYVKRVRAAVSEHLARNGLELEAVSLTGMDQTNMEYFNPSNAFDAEGLTRLTEEIERRKKIRNDIEQDTMIEIRNKNLEAEKMALQIDRDSEFARLEQQRDIEGRRAGQRAEVERERAERERESEEAQITARLATERARIEQERALDQARIEREQDTQTLEVRRRRALEDAEIRAREETERDRIAVDRGLEEDRIASQAETERMEIERRRSVELAEQDRAIALAEKARERAKADAETEREQLLALLAVERARIQRDRQLEEDRIAREKALQSLEVGRRQALEEAEISAREDVERARISTETALEEARIVQDREIRRLEVDRRRVLEVAELDRSILIAAKSKEQSEALVDSETARAKAIVAEEKTFSARELEIAERRKAIELVLARQEAEREGIRARLSAETERLTASEKAEAQRLLAEGEAESEKLRALAAKLRYEIDAEGRRQMNEAQNVLSDQSRGSEMRLRLIDRLEGIVRESVKPMEKIEGIKILQVDGLGGGGSGGGRGGDQGGGGFSDQVVNSALRYRAQAPLIDSLLEEIGLNGGDIGRLSNPLGPVGGAAATPPSTSGKSGGKSKS
ncbi:MAG: flotillin domain-containing protein [Tistlia sp.]|uniref:flotillin domain-containing protein n=1 Tax=Tistlia sp. TaxID=3057121 RepID=UPI0034A2532B